MGWVLYFTFVFFFYVQNVPIYFFIALKNFGKYNMSLYTELQLLKAEEMVLVKLTSKFNDQLNRLKVFA